MISIVLSETGYLDKIEKNIEQSLGVDKKTTKHKIETIKRAIEKTEKEIESIFKLVTNMASGSSGSELIQEKLQLLADKKKNLERELHTETITEENAHQLEGSKKYIEANAKAIKGS